MECLLDDLSLLKIDFVFCSFGSLSFSSFVFCPNLVAARSSVPLTFTLRSFFFYMSFLSFSLYFWKWLRTCVIVLVPTNADMSSQFCPYFSSPGLVGDYLARTDCAHPIANCHCLIEILCLKVYR